MRTVLVTGCAGFIGSHVAKACLSRGDRVTGVDSLNDYYSVGQKSDNLRVLQQFDRFEFVHADVASTGRDLLEGVDLVFHEAGQPGVRESWRERFCEYLSRNVAATQHLLEAAVAARTPRFVFASSSAVYGNAPSYPVDEGAHPRPLSPYGVTKLAAEHLCSLYAANMGLSVVSLRYFTAYGPRQRPDMAIHRLIDSALSGVPFVQFGDGSQVRDLTFVGDIVRANLAAADADVPAGMVANVAGGSLCSLNDLITMVRHNVAGEITIESRHAAPGDVQFTSGAVDLAHRAFGWEPTVSLSEGLEQQAKWHRSSQSWRSNSDLELRPEIVRQRNAR
jgi:nucleoside-diphosphate-sugar epimerase